MARSTRTPSISTTSRITAPPSRVTTARPASMTTQSSAHPVDNPTTYEPSKVSSVGSLGPGAPLHGRGAYPGRQGLRKTQPPDLRPSVENCQRAPLARLSVPHHRMPPPPPCPSHPDPKPWADSKARRREKGATLSSSEEARRRTRILRRHRGICHVCSLPFADQVDHVIPLAEGGADTDDNCRPIHAEPCHRVKTAAERRRAIDRRRG